MIALSFGSWLSLQQWAYELNHWHCCYSCLATFTLWNLGFVILVPANFPDSLLVVSHKAFSRCRRQHELISASKIRTGSLWQVSRLSCCLTPYNIGESGTQNYSNNNKPVLPAAKWRLMHSSSDPFFSISVDSMVNYLIWNDLISDFSLLMCICRTPKLSDD